MTVSRIMSTETEYGVYRPGDPWANPMVLSAKAVQAYAAISRDGDPVRWDYTAEDPLNDLRGHRMSRAAADPSLLTDDPYRLAPSGGTESMARPTAEEALLPAATTAVLTNGARLYVDHAHPEYSAPETSNPRDAVLWDRAGEVIARRIMDRIDQSDEEPLVLVKNNTDGKGASYGTHENYQVKRIVDLDDLINGLTPFLVSRPVLCGAGRVGLGQRSELPGFQISQRADFVEAEVGLETTFNRPIFNTRDEPHANPAYHRRLHVINGDGNRFDVSAYLRFGTTAAVLWAIEQGIGMEWDGLGLDDPVRDTWEISRDPDLTHKVQVASGRSYTAPELQQVYLDLVLGTHERLGTTPDEQEQHLLDTWQSVIDRMRTDLFSVAADVEWVAKYQLLSRMAERLGGDWTDARIAAFDLQWADLREGRSPVDKLDAAGRVTRMFTPAEVEAAADEPPQDTRALIRGTAVKKLPHLVKASWTSLVVDEPGESALTRRPIPDAAGVDQDLLDLVNRGKIASGDTDNATKE